MNHNMISLITLKVLYKNRYFGLRGIAGKTPFD